LDAWRRAPLPYNPVWRCGHQSIFVSTRSITLESL
jgi:hypothetical protein